MSRFIAAALLWLAGTLPVAAQQYSYSRDLDLIRRSAPPNGPLQNIYWVSIPVIPQVADAADSGSSLPNKCVGDLDGPPAGDGLINADDLVCAWWTARSNRSTAGSFTLVRIVPNRCTFDFRTATVALGTVHFLGIPFALEEGIGYQVHVSVAPDSLASPRNRASIAGDPDPAFTGRAVVPTPTCLAGQTVDCCASAATRVDLVSVPVDTLYSKSSEILCGLEGVDWTDANRDGKPDRCWDDVDADGVWDAGEATTGVFDGRVAVSVSYFGNTEAINGPSSHTATIQLGALRFTGRSFSLEPGDAYLFTLSKPHSPTVFLPPVP